MPESGIVKGLESYSDSDSRAGVRPPLAVTNPKLQINKSTGIHIDPFHSQINETRTTEFDCCLAVPLIAASAGDKIELVVARTSRVFQLRPGSQVMKICMARSAL